MNFGSKFIILISLHTSPLSAVAKAELQRVKDVVDFGDQVLALVGMHLLVLDICVLLELACHQSLCLYRRLQDQLLYLAIQLLNLTYLAG